MSNSQIRKTSRSNVNCLQDKKDNYYSNNWIKTAQTLSWRNVEMPLQMHNEYPDILFKKIVDQRFRIFIYLFCV